MLQNTIAPSLSLILLLNYVWIFHQVLKDFSICAVFWLCSIVYVYYAFLLYNLMFGAVITINWFQSKRCWIFIIYSNHFSGLTGYCNIFECCIVLYSFFFLNIFLPLIPLVWLEILAFVELNQYNLFSSLMHWWQVITGKLKYSVKEVSPSCFQKLVYWVLEPGKFKHPLRRVHLINCFVTKFLERKDSK